MEMNIKIDMDNTAFDPRWGKHESARILRELADNLDDQEPSTIGGDLRDSEGHIVGNWGISQKNT